MRNNVCASTYSEQLIKEAMNLMNEFHIMHSFAFDVVFDIMELLVSGLLY